MEFRLPELGENIDTATVANVNVSEGAEITADTEVIEVETEKAVMQVPCPIAGKITKLHVKAGDTIKPGAVIFDIESDGKGSPKDAAAKEEPAKTESAKTEAKAPAPKKEEAKSSQPQPAEPGKPAPQSAPAARAKDGRPAPAGPATRRLARELGIDLQAVVGSGPGGRISLMDVHKAAALRGGGGGGVAVPPLPDFAQWGPVERQAQNKIRQVAAVNLSVAWQVAPHVTQHEMCDITDLEQARKRYVERAGDSRPKVTMTVLAIKAVCSALKQFPQFNASYDSAKSEVILKKYYNIGIAVDTENGLLVPVVRNVDQKSILQLAAEVTELAAKARARKLDVSDFKGGTFTISNLGGIGGSFFTPIVNYPEVAILGMSRSRDQLVLRNGKPENRLMLPLSLSYDHRVVNGADAARFITALSAALSDPFDLLADI